MQRLIKMVVPKIKMNNGLEIPIVGLGTWKSKPGEVKQAVIDAINAGYTHIDCAHVYQNEAEVGAALKEKFEDGTITRKDIFITSKCWNTFHSFSKVEEAIRQTLKNLGLDYLDLYLIHWPLGYKENAEMFPLGADGQMLPSDIDYIETWKGMEHVVTKGLTKSIGLSNFNSQQVKRVLDHCTIRPVCNQVECHPWLNNKKLIEFCRNLGIVTVAYSPLASPDRPWAKPGDPVLMEEPKLKELAKKYNKSVVQVLLRYQTQRGVIVIPKSVTKERIIHNLDCLDFDISAEDIALIETMDCNGRICPESSAINHPHYPFNIEF